MKKVAILQSNYIPWKGYFDIINLVDEFILFDDMQYTRRDWRNRNKIRASGGIEWLTIPVEVKGKFLQKIKETRVADHKWAENHWKAIQMNYARAPYFKELSPWLRDLYRQAGQKDFLSEINYMFLTAICDYLGIQTKITWSSDYVLAEGKTERLVELVKSVGGSYYLSGPAAKVYIVDRYFEQAGVQLAYMNYSGYPEYPQRFKYPFEHGVSILDLLFNVGKDAPRYIWGWRIQQ